MSVREEVRKVACFHCNIQQFGCHHHEYDEQGIEDFLSAIRKVVEGEIQDRINLWKSHGTEGELASPYSHLTLVGELEVVKKNILKEFE